MRHQALVLSVLVSLPVFGVWACGDNRIELPDAYIYRAAPHAPMPRVLRHKGNVLSSVQLVTITVAGYAARERVEQFGTMIVGSSWYTTVAAEYGVGSGTHVQQVVVAPPSGPMTRDSIATMVRQLISEDTVVRPQASGNQVLYLIYVPGALTIDGDLANVIGYHQSVALGTTRVPIAVAIDRLDDASTDGANPGNDPTHIAAHQLINAVTNPYGDGYHADPPMIDPWSLARGEVADLCEGERPNIESGFALPRVYSDAATVLGDPPCIPADPGDPWNDVTADPSTMPVMDPGTSTTFVLTGWSTREVPDWTLDTRVADFSELSESDMQPEFSDNIINNGLSVTLTLHVPGGARAGARGGVYVLSGENQHRWTVGFVVKETALR
jgi:hypothetical protein